MIEIGIILIICWLMCGAVIYDFSLAKDDKKHSKWIMLCGPFILTYMAGYYFAEWIDKRIK